MVNGVNIRLYCTLFMFLTLGVDSVAHSQSVSLFSSSFAENTKKRCKKVYDCIIGNDETCKPDEIIAVRIALFVFCAGMYQIREKRRISEATILKKRTAFLKGIKKRQADENQPEENSDLSCVICLEKNKESCDLIPCGEINKDIPLHSEGGLCLTCLRTLIVRKENCPLCRANFGFFN